MKRKLTIRCAFEDEDRIVKELISLGCYSFWKTINHEIIPGLGRQPSSYKIKFTCCSETALILKLKYPESIVDE
jgi:hypothetical protein